MVAPVEQLRVEPSLDVTPFALHGTDGHAQRRGGLLDREAGEVAQVDDPALPRIVCLKTPQRLVERENILCGRLDGDMCC